MNPTGQPPRAALHTLGCRVNQAETALLAGRLRAAGFLVVPWGEPADLLIVNSCTVTASAARKTRQCVRAARRRQPRAFLVLAGCDATAAAAAWQREAAVDLVVPNADKARLVRLLPRDRFPVAAPAGGPPAPAPDEQGFRESGCGWTPERTRANLKVQDGCDCRCRYCIIPSVRGAPRSRAWDDVLREVRELAARGCRELVLAGINLGLYADHGRRLPELAAAVLAAAPDARLRLSSIEPGPDLAAVVAFLAEEPRACRHLHVPLQYAEDGILEAMGRRVRVAEYAEFAARATARIPGLCLGTDVIVGFPGETEAAFAACRDNVAALPLAYLHVFPFSPRPGTPAATLPGRVPGAAVRERCRELERLAAGKARAFVEAQAGRRLVVLTETCAPDGRWTGLSDNYLETELEGAAAGLGANEFVAVEVNAAGTGRAATGRWLGPADARRDGGVVSLAPGVGAAG